VYEVERSHKGWFADIRKHRRKVRPNDVLEDCHRPRVQTPDGLRITRQASTAGPGPRICSVRRTLSEHGGPWPEELPRLIMPIRAGPALGSSQLQMIATAFCFPVADCFRSDILRKPFNVRRISGAVSWTGRVPHHPAAGGRPCGRWRPDWVGSDQPWWLDLARLQKPQLHASWAGRRRSSSWLGRGQ
jgi:hypothetical protein